MRPLGFEPLTSRLGRALVTGLGVGAGGAVLLLSVVVARRQSTEPRLALTAAALGFGAGFTCGFAGVLLALHQAPPQPEGEGDTEAGVLGHWRPPTPPLTSRLRPQLDGKPD